MSDTNSYVKVIHIESGLGNQMLDYVECLAVKQANPNSVCYLETIISELPDADKKISQWNGIELYKIFKNIQEPNVSMLFTSEAWDKIIADVNKSEFWNKHWDYPNAIESALSSQGLELKNYCKSLDTYRREDEDYKLNPIEKCRLFLTKFFRTKPGNWIKRKLKHILLPIEIGKIKKQSDFLFETRKNNEYLGHNLIFQYKGADIDRIDKMIRNTFHFPDFSDEKNISFAKYLETVNAVAVHVRRGDLITVGAAGEYYKFGYFKRAIKYIKRKVNNPVFIFFCDPGSREWCEKNMDLFALSNEKDIIEYVDWNKGENSYRDMQLMSLCKHNIVTNSSFGWWGAYLNNNPNKITISPEWIINTTVTV